MLGMPKVKPLGPVIRALREEAGISRHALARIAKLDPAVVVRIETQTRAGVQFATVCHLAAALGVSLDELAERVHLKKSSGHAHKRDDRITALLTHTRAARMLIDRAARELETADEL